MRRPARSLTRSLTRSVTFTLAFTAVSAVAAGAVQAQSGFVNFSEYRSPVTTEYPAAVGEPLRSAGFEFYVSDASVPGARNALSTWGRSPADPGFVNVPSNAGTSGVLSATVGGELIEMMGAGSDFFAPSVEFNVYSMDVAHLFSQPFVPSLSNFNLTFFGLFAGGELISQAFTIFAPPLVGGTRTPFLQTLTFNDQWRNIVDLAWFQGGGATAHQFTNIQASVVPEPSVVLLLATGFGVLGLVARRRRRA